MAYLTPVPDQSLSHATLTLVEAARRNGTPSAAAMAVLARRPELAHDWARFWNDAFYAGTVEHPIKELVRMRLAGAIGCGT